MRFSFVRPLPLIAISGFACGSLFSQTVVKPSTAASKIEPGLELGVNWKWWVAPPEKQEWGMPLPDELKPKEPGDPMAEGGAPAVERPETYEVKKGDAIIKIAKKFQMTVWQLKQYNELKDDLIHIGQVLRIPTPGELLTMIPPPPPPAPEPKKEAAGKKKSDKAIVVPEQAPDPDPGGELQRELENVRLQVFLDREMFSPGMIDGKPSATFLKISELYQRTHPDAADPGLLKVKAEAALKEPYTGYVLRADDFKFIKPPKDEWVAAKGKEPSAAKKKTAKPDKAAAPTPPPPVTIDGLVAADFLGYTSAWEFVAERFHCDEAFLHHINSQIKGVPVVGTEFQVPNVIPFEIEKALETPLQPAADPQKPITAAVVVVSRLEIYQEGKLIAAMPLTTARPGLHGRGSWTVLNAIPQPRMATKREPREVPKEKPASAPEPAQAGQDMANAKPVIDPPLEKEQYLTSGPNNPVGIIWINLAKTGTTDPLPYGLHGTSIPAKMGTLQGIGGLRLTNWDIARATRLMPVGTALQWKAQ
ncbi:MAG: LysM peptidoglycan-binding domain-containing protein [Luteolibacter sp.]